MKLSMFAVYDEVAKIFKYMFFRNRAGEAIRYFADSCSDQKTELHLHPSDFSLFRLGELDIESGFFISLDIPERVARASDYSEVSNERVVNQ